MTGQNYELIENELAEQQLELEEIRHELETKKRLDRVQLTFSWILMAGAILTLGLIFLSSFDIPHVSVRTELLRPMIDVVIVELAAIVAMYLANRLDEGGRGSRVRLSVRRRFGGF